jgi:7-cyano-7-deazaguanine synthase
MNGDALLLYSGGQDSTVCLAWALERFENVETVGFAYGQRHAVELDARQKVLGEIRRLYPAWSPHLGHDHVLDLAALGQLSETALTRRAPFETTAAGVPTTFVPGRNLLFFTYAAALGYRRNITTLVGGMCQTDFSGYPDCRYSTLDVLAKAISLGMAKEFTIQTPLMWIDKADTWRMARDLGGDTLIELILEETHTCYLGIRSRRHAWGYGCNHCPACLLRRKGWEAWQKGQS